MGFSQKEILLYLYLSSSYLFLARFLSTSPREMRSLPPPYIAILLVSLCLALQTPAFGKNNNLCKDAGRFMRMHLLGSITNSWGITDFSDIFGTEIPSFPNLPNPLILQLFILVQLLVDAISKRFSHIT